MVGGLGAPFSLAGNIRSYIPHILAAARQLRTPIDKHEWRYMRTKDLYTFRHYKAFTDARARKILSLRRRVSMC
jgi:hypothetical protein